MCTIKVLHVDIKHEYKRWTTRLELVTTTLISLQKTLHLFGLFFIIIFLDNHIQNKMSFNNIINCKSNLNSLIGFKPSTYKLKKYLVGTYKLKIIIQLLLITNHLILKILCFNVVDGAKRADILNTKKNLEL